MVSGPGTVAFGNATSPATTATFSADGTYVLRLTASDGSLQTSDQMTVVVQSQPGSSQSSTGLVGWCDAQGNGEWAITIRCGIARRDTLRLFAGAGIVEASNPASEWEEVQAKLGTMLSACGLAA